MYDQCDGAVIYTRCLRQWLQTDFYPIYEQPDSLILVFLISRTAPVVNPQKDRGLGRDLDRNPGVPRRRLPERPPATRVGRRRRGAHLPGLCLLQI